jgi:hypothetical protein
VIFWSKIIRAVVGVVNDLFYLSNIPYAVEPEEKNRQRRILETLKREIRSTNNGLSYNLSPKGRFKNSIFKINVPSKRNRSRIPLLRGV